MQHTHGSMADLHAEVQSASFWSQESNAQVLATREQLRYEDPVTLGQAVVVVPALNFYGLGLRVQTLHPRHHAGARPVAAVPRPCPEFCGLGFVSGRLQPCIVCEPRCAGMLGHGNNGLTEVPQSGPSGGQRCVGQRDQHAVWLMLFGSRDCQPSCAGASSDLMPKHTDLAPQTGIMQAHVQRPELIWPVHAASQGACPRIHKTLAPAGRRS